MGRSAAIALVGLVVTVLASPALAASNAVHVGIHRSQVHDDPHNQDFRGARVHIEIDDDTGYYLDYERRFLFVMGMKAGLASNSYQLDSGTTRRLRNLEMELVTLNLMVHPILKGPVDLYVGVGPAYVRYDGLATGSGLHNDVTWNIEAGVDIKFGKIPVGVNLHWKRINTSLSNEGVGLSSDLQVNPVNIGVGASLRW